MSARERAEKLIQAQVKAQQEVGGENLRAAKPSVSRFSNVKVPKGNLLRAPPQPARSVSDHIMREPFHTWEEDDQSIASAKAPAKPAPEPMKPPEVHLQGLPDISSDSEDDEPAASEAVDAESADEGDTTAQMQEKTLLPMVSEEELRDREQQFRDLLQKAKETLKASIFAFEEKQQEQEEKPVYPELSPIKIVVPIDRSEQLSRALDQVISADKPASPIQDVESTPVEDETVPAAPSRGNSAGSNGGASGSGRITTTSSSRMYMVEPDAQLAAPAPLAPSRVQGGKRAPDATTRAIDEKSTGTVGARIVQGVRKPEADSAPPLITERITDEVSFLNIKISKPKAREFDWTTSAADSQSAAAESSVQPPGEPAVDMATSTTAAKEVTTVMEAATALPDEGREGAATGAIVVPSLPTHWLPSNGGIGFDVRTSLGSQNDMQRPITPLSARSSATREPIPTAVARPLSARSFGVAAGSKRSSSALQSFVLPKAVHDRMLSSESSKCVPPPPLEQNVLKLSAAAASSAPSPSPGPGAAALLRSHSLQGISEAARLPRQPSSQSMM